MSYQRYIESIEKLKEKDVYRFLRETISCGKRLTYKGIDYLDFSSNDYLGLSAKIELWNKFVETPGFEKSVFGGGSCSSRLLTGNGISYSKLENLLSGLYKRDAALVFNSGYHANLGILPALVSKNDFVLADKLVHASIIDGLQLSKSKIFRYRHNDMNHLEYFLEKQRKDFDQVFIVTESVFSMDGDTADLKKLVELKNKYNLFLYVDEAHAIGVLGEKGLGLCEKENLTDHIDFIIGTFGKAVASQGAFLVCDSVIRDFLINTTRPLIFTTALPSFSLEWTICSLQHIITMTAEREKLTLLSRYFREQLESLELKTIGDSQIVPLILGENKAVVALSDYLQANHIFVLPVRPPTVPEGTARLRFSINAQMDQDDIDHVIHLLKTR